jgi:hypothetical protein
MRHSPESAAYGLTRWPWPSSRRSTTSSNAWAVIRLTVLALRVGFPRCARHCCHSRRSRRDGSISSRCLARRSLLCQTPSLPTCSTGCSRISAMGHAAWPSHTTRPLKSQVTGTNRSSKSVPRASVSSRRRPIEEMTQSDGVGQWRMPAPLSVSKWSTTARFSAGVIYRRG